MRSALIIGTNDYRDGRLRRLRAPAHDVAELDRVLSNPELGGFDVDVLVDPDENTLRRRVSSFFKERSRDDLLLLHFSCHGVKNEHGDLHFAAVDTDLDDLEATAVSAEFVNTVMARSLCRRIVLLLDCCYSGAFGRSALARGSDGVEIKERFDGQGRVVLTASTAMEYAFEGGDVIGDGKPSVFSAAVVEGIRSGAADRDGDGEITVDELYDYVYDTVRAQSPSQTPSKWSYDVHGDFYIAKSNAVYDPFKMLPAELVGAVQSPLANVRESAVAVLLDLVRGHHPAKEQRAARTLLEQLADDDSRRVASAAATALGVDAPAVRANMPPMLPPPPRIEAGPTVPPVSTPPEPPTRSDMTARSTGSGGLRIRIPAGAAARVAWAGALGLVGATVTQNDGFLFARPDNWAFPLALVVTSAFVIGLVSSLALLTLEGSIHLRRAVLCFASLAGLTLVVEQIGAIVDDHAFSGYGLDDSVAIGLLVASSLLLAGSTLALRSARGSDPHESPTLSTRARTGVAMLTAAGGSAFVLALVLPVINYERDGFFLGPLNDNWGNALVPLKNGWPLFVASAMIAGLALVTSVWLGANKSTAADRACGVLVALTLPVATAALLLVRLGDGLYTIGTVCILVAAACLAGATTIVLRSTTRAVSGADTRAKDASAPAAARGGRGLVVS